MLDITIKNFRCYENKTMTFRSGINLLIGDNSVGKTSLLRACNMIINSFFSGFSDEYTAWKSMESEDFREVASENVIAAKERPINISFHLSETDLPPVTTEAQGVYRFDYDEQQSLICNSKKNRSNLVSGVKSLRDYASVLMSNSTIIENGEPHQLNPLPVYAYFTTEDVHTKRKFPKEKTLFKKYPQKPSFGYYECFDSKGLLDCWVKRLLVLQEARKGSCEIENVRSAVRDALGADGCGIINDIEVRPNDGEVMFELTDGRLVRTDLLSDGYRRLVGIVVDVAIRCALLNKVMYDGNAYKHTHGTVIIDEIDEHLHPALQVRVLKAMHRTFPKIQFIISTHSPLVMSSVEPKPENVVYKLDYDSSNGKYSHNELNTYGLDASTIIKCCMDESSRDLTVGGKIKEIESLIEKEKYVEARGMLTELQNMTKTDDPEFSYLGSVISFAEDDV
jgi:predicted ATP-binding protein involved in virulence